MEPPARPGEEIDRTGGGVGGGGGTRVRGRGVCYAVAQAVPLRLKASGAENEPP